MNQRGFVLAIMAVGHGERALHLGEVSQITDLQSQGESLTAITDVEVG